MTAPPEPGDRARAKRKDQVQRARAGETDRRRHRMAIAAGHPVAKVVGAQDGDLTQKVMAQIATGLARELADRFDREGPANVLAYLRQRGRD